MQYLDIVVLLYLTLLSWFVGILKTKSDAFVFAANATDRVPDPKDRGLTSEVEAELIQKITK